MSEAVLIRFVRPHRQYSPGDIAGFPAKEAQKILGARVEGFRRGADGERHKASESVAVLYDQNARQLDPEPYAPPTAGPEPELVSVRFTYARGPYSAGDTAGFPPEQARRLVEGYRGNFGPVAPCAVYAESSGEPAAPAQKAAEPQAAAPAPPRDVDIPADLSRERKPRLRAIAAALGLDTTGKADALRARIEEARG